METAINIPSWKIFLLQGAPAWISLAAACLILILGIVPAFKRSFFPIFVFSLAVALLVLLVSWRLWWVAPGEAMGMFFFDRLTYFFSILFSMTVALTLLISWDYLKEIGIERPEYYALLLFSSFGMFCMAAGHNLIVVFLGLEIMSIAIYVLAGFVRSRRSSVEASLKYFLVGAFASSFLLLGLAFLYGAAGTLDLLELHSRGREILGGANRLYALLGYAFLAVGLGFKIALVPFHFWLPDVYEGAPVPITSFMATAVKVAGFAALLRVTWAYFQWEELMFDRLCWVASVLTMTLGNIAALRQQNLKRMLAYSSIAHTGYALIPLTGFSPYGFGALSSIGFYLFAYIVMTIGAFAVVIALTGEGREKSDIEFLSGLSEKKPVLAAAMTLFMISLAGIPPTIGFFGKYYIFSHAIRSGFVVLVVIALINSVISVYYYLRPVVVMYFRRATEDGGAPSLGGALPLSNGVFSVIVLMLLAVGYFGLFPGDLLSFLDQTVGQLVAAGVR